MKAPGDKPVDRREREGKNALAGEVSPYLLQHVSNPVDWFPWGPEAFEKAAAEDKPVFLSIGYSTCHWCHVMEKESFSDPEVARMMNETFVSVKVDREERPDIDHFFMAVCQGMTGGGGWPLTVIMTPEGKPFYSATYLPERSRGGLIGMVELVERIRELWKDRKGDLFRSADEITSAVKKISASTPAEGGGKDFSQPVFDYLEEVYDQRFGGFSGAPKFPVPHNLLFLLRYWRRNQHQPALDMVEGTIQNLRRGGVYDQIGYGFHRYSTDEGWLIPHFEKMLYDQALLSLVYIEAYQATGKEGYRKTAEEIFEYVLRDMTSPDGAFYSAEDADSEGEEGKFYWWTEAGIKDLLGEERAGVALAAFSVTARGNFPPGSGRNVLHITEPLSETAGKLGLGNEECLEFLESARKDLWAARGKRVPPLKDDKVLTDWNGLMIAALAKGGAVFENAGYRKAAARAAEFILKNLQGKDGRLLHRWRFGQAALEANLDDYSFFTWGLIELYQATFDVRYLKEALKFQDLTLSRFWDGGSAGFFFTPEGEDELPLRMKIYEDTAMPSGNSVAAYNLFRLGRLTGNPGYEEKGDSLGRAFEGRVGGFPTASTMWVAASDFGRGPTSEVAVIGDPAREDTRAMLRALRSSYLPEAVIILVPPGKEGEGIKRLAPFTRDLKAVDGRATAYVCRNFSCRLPTGDISVMLEQLRVEA